MQNEGAVGPGVIHLRSKALTKSGAVDRLGEPERTRYERTTRGAGAETAMDRRLTFSEGR